MALPYPTEGRAVTGQLRFPVRAFDQPEQDAARAGVHEDRAGRRPFVDHQVDAFGS